MKKALIGIVLAGALAFTACSNPAEQASEPDQTVYVQANNGASELVTYYEALHPGTIAKFCGYVDTLGYDAGLTAFSDGYGTDQNPNAQEVFDEILSRC